MSDYVPTDWVDNVTPVDATRMDHLEAGVDVNRDFSLDHEARLDAAEADLGGRLNDIALTTANWDTALENGWYTGTPGSNAPGPLAGATRVLGRVERGSADLVTQTVWEATLDEDLLAPTYQRRRVGGVFGAWILVETGGGGGSSIEYENAWSGAVSYDPGMVVIHNGVEYLAVNPSLNQEPPAPAGQAPLVISLVTALPSSPFDGQEIILCDSLTSPTFTWRLRYVAAKATNKWVFIGGAPIVATVETAESTASTTYVALTTAGPIIAIPVAGSYDVEVSFEMGTGGGQYSMSYDIGGVAAVDADRAYFAQSSGLQAVALRTRRKDLTAVTLTSKYKVNTGTLAFGKRTLRVLPVAVGG